MQARKVTSRREFLKFSALGATGALIFAACSPSGPSAPAAAPTSPAATGPAAQPTAPAATPASSTPLAAATAGAPPVKLVFWRHQYDPMDKVYQGVIFPAARDKLNIEFDYQVQRDDDYKAKMLPQIAAGTGPDLFEASEAFRLKFARAGLFAPLDYTAWGGKDKWETFWAPGVLQALRVDGKDFNVTLDWLGIPNCLFVNGSHAEEAGIANDIAKYQQTPISWAEFGPWAAKMTRRDASGRISRDGFMIVHGYGPDRLFDHWDPYFRQVGGRAVSADGKTSMVNSEAGVAALQNLYDDVFTYGASMLRPQDKESGSAKLPKEETSSAIAMSQWAYGTFKQLAPDKWQNIRALLPPQVDPSKPLYDSGPVWAQGVLAKSQYPDVAFRFLHMAADTFGNDLFQAGAITPVAGWTEKYPGLKSLPDANVWLKLSTAATPVIRSESELLTGTQRSSGFLRAFEAVMFNNSDIKAELARWNTEVQDALNNQ